MRVLITAIRHSIDGAGGSSRLAYDQALHLNSLGHEVWMLAPGTNLEGPEYEVRNGIHFLRYLYRPRHMLDPRRLGDEKRSIADALRRRAPERFDVVHGHSALQHRAACAAVRHKERVCFSVHSPVVDETLAASGRGSLSAVMKHAIRSPFLAKIERDCLTGTDWISCFSNFTRSRMHELHGSLADNIEVTPGWANTSRFRMIPDRNAAKRDLGWRTDVPVLFTLRRLVPRMGLDRLIKAAHLLQWREALSFQLIIGGQGPLRQSLESLSRDLGMSDAIIFTGFLPDEVLPLAYGACDAFALPTAELECFGIIAVEALACGRPVLATPVAAIPEIVSRVEPKWLASGTDPESIARLLGQFLRGELPTHDPERLRTTAEEHWGMDRLHLFCDRALGHGDRACVNWTVSNSSSVAAVRP